MLNHLGSIFFIFFFSIVHAQSDVLGYAYRHFSTANGLSQNTVNDAVFDSNGYLWISIHKDNVYTYDGYNFSPCWYIDNGAKQPFKNASLFSAKNGDLWFFHEKGIHLRKLNSNQFEFITDDVRATEFLATGSVKEIIGGKIFFIRSNIFSFKEVELYVIDTERKTKGLIDKIATITTTQDLSNPIAYNGYSIKGIWTINAYGEYTFFDFAKSTFTIKASTHFLKAISGAFSINDTLYVTDAKKRVFYFDGLSWKQKPGTNHFRAYSPNITSIFTTGNRIFWSYGSRIYESDIDNLFVTKEIIGLEGKPILGKGRVKKILLDNSGHLWLFTNAEGIYQLDIRKKKISHFKSKAGQENFVKSIYKDDETGMIWVGLFYGGFLVYTVDGKVFKNYSKGFEGYPNALERGFCVNGFLKLNAKVYLIWCNIDNGFIVNTTNWKFKKITTNSKYLQQIKQKNPIDFGGFLIQNDSSFVSFLKQGIAFLTIKNEQLNIYNEHFANEERPEAFFKETNWFFYGATGKIIKYNLATQQTDSLVLSHNAKVKWISRDSKGRLWAATENGITVFENNKEIKKLAAVDGLPNQYVYVAEPDFAGKIWCSSNNGIFSINEDDYAITHYTTADGLQSEEFNTGAFYKDKKGNFYFGGINGINFFNPASMQVNNSNDKVHISSVGSPKSVFYKYNNDAVPKNITLGYKTNLIIIRYSPLNFKTSGFNQFEYRLHSRDSIWLDNGGSNELKLTLTPGVYQIQIRLKGNYQSITTINVTITPPFSKTIWFFLLLLTVLSLLTALAVNRYNQNKFKKLKAQLELERKVQLEKERIARDLHDNIGVQANAILHSASILKDATGTSTDIADNLHSTAKAMLLSLRETLWAMKHEEVPAGELWIRIINFTKSLQNHYKYIDTGISGTAPANFLINAQTALHIVMIVQEAANNAIKHAQATAIKLSSAVEKNNWKISIIDNGIGFNVNQTHRIDAFGLQNMQQRAQEANVLFQLHSKKNIGTQVQLLISLNK
jgi:signal transduction histidine kinase/ligand-binding sensor domain-containing protein